MDLEKTLENYGLDEKQAKIYLATLELGSASVQKISQKAGLPRSTCYEVLETLSQKGLISTFLKKKIKYFSAEEPEKIIDLTREKIQGFEKALPQFRALYGEARIRPTARFYQGEQGIKIILDEILKEADELLAFSSAEDLFSALPDFPRFVEKRVKKKIPSRVILRESEKAQERKALGPKELRQVKIIPASYDYHGLIYIWHNKIAMFSFKKDMLAIVIESKELAQVQKAMFELIWNSIIEK
jgi:sugar-specific transcriptional regulator TrmB